MYVLPCRHCPEHKECKQYQTVLKTGRESSVRMSSCRIKCERFPELIFPPGTRVQAHINYGDDEYRNFSVSNETGIVMRASSSRRDKLLVHIDNLEGESDAIRYLYPSDLTLSDEPPVELCPGCNLPVNATSRPAINWFCPCDIHPSERKCVEYGIIEADIELPYPCQTVARIVEDL